MAHFPVSRVTTYLHREISPVGVAEPEAGAPACFATGIEDIDVFEAAPQPLDEDTVVL